MRILSYFRSVLPMLSKLLKDMATKTFWGNILSGNATGCHCNLFHVFPLALVFAY